MVSRSRERSHRRRETISAERPPILVLDPRVRSSLAACRSLGRAGFQVGVGGYRADRALAGPAAVSRYAAAFHVLPDPLGPSDKFAEALGSVVDRFDYGAVIATSDATLARLASIRLDTPSFPGVGGALRRLTDKLALADVCASVDVPYPASTTPRDDAEAVEASGRLGLPLVVKAVRSAEATADRVGVALGASLCKDVPQVLAAVGNVRAAGIRPLLQSRVRPNVKINAAVIRREGTSELRYAHRVLRETPVTGGIGVALETIPATSGLGGQAVAYLERVCDAAGYSGLAQAEFYGSADDGRLYLIDVNPRLWGSTSFAERLGLRVVERGVRFALGLPALPASSYPLGRRFHTPVGEWRWLREQTRRRPSLAELARTTRPWDSIEYVDWRDPLPLAAYALQLLRSGSGGSSGGDGL